MAKKKIRQATWVESIKCQHCNGTGKQLQEEIEVGEGVKPTQIKCDYCGGEGRFTKTGTSA